MASAPPARRQPGRAARLVGVAVVVGFVGLLGYGLVSKAPDDTIDTTLSEGAAAPAPGLDLPVLQRGRLGGLERRLDAALGDGRVALRELRGQPVVLNFWASWCTPCREEAPRLERSWQRARDRGVVFVGLNMQDVTDDARGFMRKFRVTYLNVRDKSDGVALDWGVTGLPETFFLRRDGKVVAHVIGAVSPERLRQGLAAAESGRPLGALEGGSRRSTR
jgi:cytochrome c biogenesis protein CcmG/thiol:disulfide interchange protein DsbE